MADEAANTNRRRQFIAVGVVLFLAAALSAAVMIPRLKQPKVTRNPVYDAVWVGLPTGDDVVAVYPPKAKAEKLKDQVYVQMRCPNAEQGGLKQCGAMG